MRAYIRFLFLFVAKCLAKLCFRFDSGWVGVPPEDGFDGSRIGILLNHTSLLEPVFLAPLPNSIIWRIASQGVFPGADITLKRPLVGKLFKLIAPDTVSISRKRDNTWEEFLNCIQPDSLVLIAPEGRMKRLNGLDKHGKPMTVRAGIVDVLQRLGHGKAILTYSGGLHHVHAPGDKFPRLFQKVRVRYEAVEISDFLGQYRHCDPRELRRKVIADLEARRDRYCHDASPPNRAL